jgi:rhodanese-related sulfurtransferase
VQFVQNNMSLVMLAIVSAVMLIWPTIGRKISGVKEAGVLEATQLINHRDALLLDVRDDVEFAGGHIASARHVPLLYLKKQVAGLEKFRDKPVVVICRSGARSATGCRVLRNAGFGEVYNFKGGMLAWEKAQMPVSK